MTTKRNSSQPLAELAADKLWQLQLRKENQAILEQLQKNEQKRHELIEANQKRFDIGEEKILKLEARIAQLEQEHINRIQSLEKFKNEQKGQSAGLKMQMRQFLQSRNLIAEDEICTIIMDKVFNTTHGDPFNEPSQNSSSGPKSFIRSLQPTQHHTSSSNEPNFQQTAKRSIKSRAKKPDNPKRPNTRNQKLSPEHNPTSISPPEITFTTKFPKLTQGRRQLKRYYEQADLARRSITFISEQSEIDFVNSFIKGTTTTKIRERLVGQLQQIYPSKQKKDGRVEILCNWTELGLAINNSTIPREKNSIIMGPKNSIETCPITN